MSFWDAMAKSHGCQRLTVPMVRQPQQLAARRPFTMRARTIDDPPVYDIAQSETFAAERQAMAYLKAPANLAWVYSCVNAIAANIAKLPLRFYLVDKYGDKKDEVTQDPMLKAFRRPSPHRSWRDFIYLTIGSLELTGMAFWKLFRYKGMLEQMVYKKATQVEIVPSKDDFISHYMYHLKNGQSIRMEADEILYMMYPDFDNDYVGLAPIRAVTNAVLMDLYAQRWNKNFFRNAGRIEGYFTTRQGVDPEHINPDEFEDVKNEWRIKYVGIDAGGQEQWGIPLMLNGLEYKQLGLAPRDMEFLESRKFSREEILAVFNVPPIAVGLLEHASFANAREQRHIFWDDKLLPTADIVADAISQVLLPRFYNETIVAEFDASKIDALKEKETERVDRQTKELNMGKKTPNQLREEDGLEPDDSPGMNTYYLPAGLVAIGGEMPEEPPPPEDEEDETEEPVETDDEDTAVEDEDVVNV